MQPIHLRTAFPTILGLLLLLISATVPLHPALADGASQGPAAGRADSNLIDRGKYVAQLGDCIACHTVGDGPAMAGGRPLATPFGVIYSTNITPDAETGIGAYSFAQFDRAMRRGVAADGHNLYPAMPYPSYAKISDDDLHALYAYLMRGLAPVHQANAPAYMRWPFSMRWGLALWKWALVDGTPFRAVAGRDALWNRGAYLVQSLGHCGACHTPRGIGFQEKAVTEAGPDGKYFLAGETVEGWRALSLRNLWTVEDTVQLLKTGQNRFATVSGNMGEVIHHSTQYFTDADLTAIAGYLKSLPPGQNELPMPPPATIAAVPPADLYTTRGGLAYAQFCSDCHRLDGAGVKDIFPPLRQNPAVSAADPASLIHILLTGSQTPETAAHRRIYTMPAFARLADRELAEIAIFLRASWGFDAKPVTEAEVRTMRAQLGPKLAASSAFETPRLADMLGQPNAEQLVRGMRLNAETRELLPDDVGNTLNCTSCHLNAGTVADGSPFVGLSAFFPSYASRAGRVITLAERINGCFLRSMNGKALPAESVEMTAMVAYFDWMKGQTKPTDTVSGRGVGKIDMAIKPDMGNGQRVYAAQCAVCHGKDGEGLADADGKVIYPPLWGDKSFNIGAGMARTYTAAAFVKRNMPIGLHAGFPLGQGGLSDQDAVDVAEYFTHQPRPEFLPKVKDWPRDPKPADARY